MIDDRHRPLLKMIGDPLLDGRVRSTTEGIEFDWHSLDGRVTTQFRPDDPGDGVKYRWPKNTVLPIGVPAGMADRVADRDRPLLLVEGTKQHLAAATQALTDPQGEAVVGLASCYGFLHEGSPTPDLLALPMAGRRVLIAMDADLTSNRDVHDAAERLAQYADLEGGAASVEFVILPGSKDGFDDILGRVADPAATYRRLVSRATARLPKKPPAPPGTGWFQRGNLLAAQAFNYIADNYHLAVTSENSIAVFDSGVYLNGQSKHFSRIVLDMLGDQFRPVHLATLHEIALTMCRTEGAVIPERLDVRLVNVRNGLLDPVTLTLHPHDPEVRTLFQFDVEWDPDARCPRFEEWIEEVMPGRRDELLDAVAPLFDPTRTPPRAVFLYGPSRSGKSTYGRLLVKMVGEAATCSVTLQQLSDNRFAAANLYGKALNVAMDLSSRDVKDLSTFKMLTGDDPVGADRKYGQQFSFTNQALILFSANEVPSVSETSKAWVSRVAPFKFPNSFIGNEDPAREEALVAELPGIFRLHILALKAQIERGGSYLDAAHPDSAEFERRSNKVAEFLHECTVPSRNPVGTPRPDLHFEYRQWCERNGYGALGRNRWLDAVRSEGVTEFKSAKGGIWHFEVALIDPEKADDHNHEKKESSTDGHTEAKRGGSPDRRADRGAAAPGADEAGHREGGTSASGPSVVRDEAAGVEDRVGTEGGRGSGAGLDDGAMGPVTEVPSAVLSTAVTATRSTNPPKSLCNIDLDTKSDIAGGSGRNAVTAVDVETASADLLFDGHPQFTRLACTPDGPIDLADLAGRTLAAHNGFGFDFHAIPGLDVIAEGDAGRLIDTMVLGVLDHPPLGRQGGDRALRDYSLAAMAQRYGIEGKSNDIKALAKRHGGFDMIPVDDPAYVAYCQQDASIVAALVERIGLSDYALREQRAMARLAGSITGVGFAVDRDLLDRRLAEGAARLDAGRSMLVERYGLPSDSAMPHRTKAGREALLKAFTDLGADPEGWPTSMRTPKGDPSFGGDAMRLLVEHADQSSDPQALVALAETVAGLNGERTVYGTAYESLHLDGRVHPSVFPVQASGRFSITDPGLTVFGKRGGKHVERDIFVADPGSVLVAFDLNQIDARAVAVHSQDAAYLALFAPGVDSHTEVALALWNDPKRREQAKAIAHGWNYGEGIAALVRNTGLPRSTVEAFDAGMRERYPRLVEWRRGVVEKGKAGVLLDNGFGRLLRVDPRHAFTQAPAYMGQSTARDLMVEGVLRLPLDIVPMIRAFVHDEIVLSIPEADLDDVQQAVLDALTFEWAPPGASTPVQITAGASRASRSWGGCYAK